MKVCGIYLLAHRDSGRCYVGQSINIEKRLRDHAKGKTGCGHLANAIAKHGWQAFDVRVVEECPPACLNEREIAWIARLGTLHPNGFNLTTGGKQYQFADAVRAIISAATKIGQTPEVRARMSASMRGVPKSLEHRAKIGAAQANSANIARITEMARNQSAVTRAKISIANTGKMRSAEVKAAMSKLKSSPENLCRLAEFSRNMSPETRAKMSARAKARMAGRTRTENGKFA